MARRQPRRRSTRPAHGRVGVAPAHAPARVHARPRSAASAHRGRILTASRRRPRARPHEAPIQRQPPSCHVCCTCAQLAATSTGCLQRPGVRRTLRVMGFACCAARRQTLQLHVPACLGRRVFGGVSLAARLWSPRCIALGTPPRAADVLGRLPTPAEPCIREGPPRSASEPRFGRWL
jgi:hypothetical protein